MKCTLSATRWLRGMLLLQAALLCFTAPALAGQTAGSKFIKQGFVAMATNNPEYGIDRQTVTEIPAASFGHEGPYAGQFIGLHIIAADSAGNIYSAESDVIGRLQLLLCPRDVDCVRAIAILGIGGGREPADRI
jgi:hypothetical protein